MDYLRSVWGLDQTRVGFLEYGQSATFEPPVKKSKLEPEIKVEVLKAIPLYNEKSRSGKQSSRYRVFVVASDGKGLVGLGIKVHRNKETATKCAGDQAKAEMFQISLSSFDPECPEQHTIPQQLFGEYGDLKVTLNPAARDTGIESSPLARFLLHLIGIKDCVVMPESSKMPAY